MAEQLKPESIVSKSGIDALNNFVSALKNLHGAQMDLIKEFPEFPELRLEFVTEGEIREVETLVNSLS